MSKGSFTIAEVEVSLDKDPEVRQGGYSITMMRETPMNAQINCGRGRHILAKDAQKIKAKILAFRKEIWKDIQKAEKNFKESYQE